MRLGLIANRAALLELMMTQLAWRLAGTDLALGQLVIRLTSESAKRAIIALAKQRLGEPLRARVIAWANKSQKAQQQRSVYVHGNWDALLAGSGNVPSDIAHAFEEGRLKEGYFLCARPAHGHLEVVTLANLDQLHDRLNSLIADSAHGDAFAALRQA